MESTSSNTDTCDGRGARLADASTAASDAFGGDGAACAVDGAATAAPMPTQGTASEATTLAEPVAAQLTQPGSAESHAGLTHTVPQVPSSASDEACGETAGDASGKAPGEGASDDNGDDYGEDYGQSPTESFDDFVASAVMSLFEAANLPVSKGQIRLFAHTCMAPVVAMDDTPPARGGAGLDH